MDWGTIQAPELLRKLFVRLGLRQAHGASTLNAGMQAVIVVDDLSRDRGDDLLPPGVNLSELRSSLVAASSGAAAGFDPFVQIINVSAPRFRIKRMIVTTDATVPTRIRVGFRNGSIGGAAPFGGFMNTSRYPAPNATPPGITINAGNAASNTNQSTQVLFELIEKQAPLVIDDPRMVLAPGAGLVVQVLSPGVGAAQNMATMFELEEAVP